MLGRPISGNLSTDIFLLRNDFVFGCLVRLLWGNLSLVPPEVLMVLNLLAPGRDPWENGDFLPANGFLLAEDTKMGAFSL